MSETGNSRPPRDNLFRAVMPGVELRAAGVGDDGPVMVINYIRFNEWTEINSIFEGRFMERFAPGSTKKTIREQRAQMRVLFQHGFDPQIGDKPLGPIADIGERDDGGWAEVPLLDAPYVRENVLPGLEADLYGASHRFRVVREEWNQDPGVSDHNPEGLPERTVKEAEIREFGPVTFPAYNGTSAGVRSVTDEFLLGKYARDPEKLRELIPAVTGTRADLAIGAVYIGDTVAWESETPCENPVRAHATYSLRCGECSSCKPDEPETYTEETTTAPVGTDAAPTRTSSQTRRNTTPLYGISRKETRTWRL